MRREPFQLEPGRTIGRYELLVSVATRGTSELWAAHATDSIRSEELVALRALLRPASVARDDEQRWRLEANVASRLRHPHLARHLELVEESGLLCSVVEWIDGRSLHHLLKRPANKGLISPAAAVQIVVQACRGVKALHELR